MSAQNNPPIAGPKGSTKLAVLDGFRQRRVEANQKALALIQAYRADPSKYRPTAADLLHIMKSVSNGKGGATTSPNRLCELKYLLGAQSELSANGCAEILGIGATLFFELRRADPELEQLVRDYQAAFFEHEAMTQDKGLHPALVIFGLKSRSGWIDAKDRAVTQEQLSALTEQLIGVLREELAEYPGVLERIVARLNGEPIPTASSVQP